MKFGALSVPLAVIAPVVALLVAGAIALVFNAPQRLVEWTSESLIGQLAVVAAAILVHTQSVRLYARRIQSIMYARSGAAPPAPPKPARRIPVPDDGPTLVLGPGSGRLHFHTYDRTTKADVDTAGEIYVRSRLVNPSASIFFWSIMFGLVSNVYGAWVWIKAHPEAATESFVWFQPLVPPLLAIVLLISLYRHFLRITVFITIVVSLVSNGWFMLASAAKNPETSMAKAIAEIDTTFGSQQLSGFWGPVLIGALVARWVVRKPRQAQGPGRRLLVLRVFGVDTNTASLFQYIVQRWPFVGPVVTIVDPTYAAFTFARVRYALAMFLTVPSLLMLPPLTDPLSTTWTIVVRVSASYCIALPVIFIWTLWRLHQSTGRNLAGIQRRLALETLSFFQSRYSSIRMVCFDDLWQPTLRQLVRWSDTVMMDLRGFTTARRGSQWELGYLMNNWHLSRTLFLVDETTDMALFRATLSHQWQTMRPESPNRKSRDVEVHVYSATYSGAALSREVVPILSVLSVLTNTPIPPRPESIPEPQEQVALTYLVRLGVPSAWLIFAGGVFYFILVPIPDFTPTSPMTVMTVGLVAVLLSTRMRTVLVRDGHVGRMFDSWLWKLGLILVLGLVFWQVLQ